MGCNGIALRSLKSRQNWYVQGQPVMGWDVGFRSNRSSRPSSLSVKGCRVGAATRLPSRPGESHPEPLTDPDMNLSIHPARAIA
jgi:hypothetical protein